MRAFFLVPLFCFSLVAQAALDPLSEAEDRRLVDAEVLQEAAVSRKASLRERAAVAYGRIQSPRGIDPLFRLLNDSEPGVRRAAAFSLGQLGWQSDFAGGRESEIQTKLAAAIGDSELSVRRASVEALGKVGLMRTPELLAPHLSDSELRNDVLMAFYRYRLVLRLRNPAVTPAPLSDELIEKVLSLARSFDRSARRNVAYYFARVTDARGEGAMAKLTRDHDKWTRFYALSALARLKSKTYKEDLTRALKDKEYVVRLAALTALTAAGEKLGGYLFLQRDPSFHVRAAFALGLDATMTSESAVLAVLLGDSSPTVRVEAVKASVVGQAPAARFAWLMKIMTDSDWRIREAAVSASSTLSVEDREKFLKAAAADRHVNVRVAALENAASLATAGGLALLARGLESTELSERGTAASGLLERTEGAVVELAWKTYANSSDRRWVELRETLVDVLAKVESELTTGLLKRVLKDPAVSVAAKAKHVLSARGVKDLPEIGASELTFSPYRDTKYDRNPVVLFRTEKGEFEVECFPKYAPVHVSNFVNQVRRGFYNRLTWHRVVSNFVIQGGDPDGSGWGDAGYSLRAEVNQVPFERGTLGMPRSQGFDTGGVQLFFTHVPTPHLDGQYTVFGRVTKGLDVVDVLERGDKIIHAIVIR